MATKDEFRVIPLTKGYVAVIDAADFRRVNRYSWYTHFSKGSGRKLGQPYARAQINGKKIYLHRFLKDVTDPKIHVDHKNQQTLDYRNDNLKVSTPAENMANRRKRPSKTKKVPK